MAKKADKTEQPEASSEWSPRSIKKLVTDPETFVSAIQGNEGVENTALDSVRESYQAEKTAEWEARGGDNIIRSSIFGTCARKTYYDYYLGGESATFPRNVQEKMYLGLLGENLFEEFLADIPGTTHVEQNEFPVHMTSPISNDDLVWVATTDFVKELEVEGEKYYIPIELKNTGLRNWDEFTYHKYHLEQIMTWIMYAKEQGLNVPYGLLVYVWKFFHWYAEHEIKVVTIATDTKFLKMSRETVDWDVQKHYMHFKRDNLKECIENLELPALETVPKYICNDCPFLNDCNVDKNTPADKGLKFGKEDT